MKNKNSRRIELFFALLALVTGFFFTNKGMTGNAILENNYSFSFFPIIGIALIFLSIVLGIHLIKNM